jgi:hypothetical protein
VRGKTVEGEEQYVLTERAKYDGDLLQAIEFEAPSCLRSRARYER